MVENNPIVEQFTELHNIIDDLENINNGYKTLVFLSSSPKSYEHFKDAFIYKKECTIIFNEVHMVVRSKDFSKVKDLKNDDNGKGLNVSSGGSEHTGKSRRFHK